MGFYLFSTAPGASQNSGNLPRWRGLQSSPPGQFCGGQQGPSNKRPRQNYKVPRALCSRHCDEALWQIPRQPRNLITPRKAVYRNTCLRLLMRARQVMLSKVPPEAPTFVSPRYRGHLAGTGCPPGFLHWAAQQVAPLKSSGVLPVAAFPPFSSINILFWLGKCVNKVYCMLVLWRCSIGSSDALLCSPVVPSLPYPRQAKPPEAWTHHSYREEQPGSELPNHKVHVAFCPPAFDFCGNS